MDTRELLLSLLLLSTVVGALYLGIKIVMVENGKKAGEKRAWQMPLFLFLFILSAWGLSELLASLVK